MQSPPAGRDTAPRPRLVLRRPGGKQPQHYYELCDDDDCPRFPCRVYKQGYDRGYQDGTVAGYAQGYSEGFADGYGQGASDGS